MEEQATKKKWFKTKTKRKLSYITKRLIGQGGPAVYLLWVANIFESGIHTEGIKTVVLVLPVWISIVLIKDFRDKAMAADNPDIGQKAIATSLFAFLPWIIIMTVISIIHMGVTNAYEHIMIISGMQIGSGVAKGFEQYYADLYKKERVKL